MSNLRIKAIWVIPHFADESGFEAKNDVIRELWKILFDHEYTHGILWGQIFALTEKLNHHLLGLSRLESKAGWPEANLVCLFNGWKFF